MRIFSGSRPLLVIWLCMLLGLAGLWALAPRRATAPNRLLVQRLQLSDLCLSTESRHTRHLSTPEWMAAFQDVPGFHDHFPSSSFLQPRPLGTDTIPMLSPFRP